MRYSWRRRSPPHAAADEMSIDGKISLAKDVSLVPALTRAAVPARATRSEGTRGQHLGGYLGGLPAPVPVIYLGAEEKPGGVLVEACSSSMVRLKPISSLIPRGISMGIFYPGCRLFHRVKSRPGGANQYLQKRC